MVTAEPEFYGPLIEGRRSIFGARVIIPDWCDTVEGAAMTFCKLAVDCKHPKSTSLMMYHGQTLGFTELSCNKNVRSLYSG